MGRTGRAGPKLCVVSKEKQLRDMPMWKRKQLENQQKPKFQSFAERMKAKRENLSTMCKDKLYKKQSKVNGIRVLNK